MTLTLTRWPSYTNLTCTPWRYTKCAKWTFYVTSFESYRLIVWQTDIIHTDIQTDRRDRNYTRRRFVGGQLAWGWKKLQDFYRPACNADAVLRWEFCPSVRLSVRLSVKRVHCDKTEEKFVQIFIPCERPLILVFRKEWLVGATTSTLNFGSTGPCRSVIADFEQTIARSASAVIPIAKKVQLTLIGSPLRALQWA